MKKIYTSCGKEKDAEQDFSWKYKDRGIRNARCKFCQSQVSKNHYHANKQSYMIRAHTRDNMVVIENRRKLAAYLAKHPCIDCALTDIRVLEFDHVRGRKKGNIAKMIRSSCSWSNLEAEDDVH